MRAVLTNLSPLPRDHWATVTFPRPLAAAFGDECTFYAEDGRCFRAVRGVSKGLKTVYRIHAFMNGNEQLRGKMGPERFVPMKADYHLHPWVSDDVAALIPDVGVRLNGGDYWSRFSTGPLLIDQSAAHTRWTVRRGIPELGIVFQWWADLLHDDPIVPVWGKIVWSHRRSPDTNAAFDHFVLKSGEYLALNFARRHGVLTPVRDGSGYWTMLLNSQRIVLNDGAGLPLSGNMLAFISPKATDAPPADPEDRQDPTVRGIANLQAGAHGPIRGVCLDWDSHWLAARHVPRFRDGYESEHEADWRRFLAEQDVPAGWFAARPVGLGKTPGQTGAQEDFGATKGTYAVVDGDARHIQVLEYSVQSELFRGFNHYEQDGSALRVENHPDWTTWNGGTHYHPAVSKDRLGKGPSAPPGTGWYGYDDEHRSQNNLAAYLMLTDDPLMEDQLRHLVTTDRASYRMRFPRNGYGAARAQGRTAGAWAQFVGLTDGEEQQHWLELLKARMNASRGNPLLHVPGPMKVLATGGPDSRKQVYGTDGRLGPWVSFWEHGLAAVGLYNLVQTPGTGNLAYTHDASEILLRVSRTLATFACFEEDGEWWTVADCLWNGGEAPPGGLSSRNRALVCSRGAASVNSWTFAGLLVAREFLAQHSDEDPDLLDKLTRYIAAVTGGQEAADRTTAEWWAAVGSVRFGAM